MSNAPFDLSIIGVAVWIVVAITVIACVWLAFARNREMQRTIRLAIEKGMQLDSALVEKLVGPKPANPVDYLIGGIISIAVGIGLPILGYFIGRHDPKALFPVVGAGILVGLIGISLLICAALISRREKSGETGNRLM